MIKSHDLFRWSYAVHGDKVKSRSGSSCRGHRSKIHALLNAAFLANLALAVPQGSAKAQQSVSREESGPSRVIGETLRIDGILDEPAWEHAWSVPAFLQLTPTEGAPPTQSSDVRIFYDGDAVYIGGRFAESDPSAIVDRDFERDGYFRAEQDAIGFFLDTDRDPRTSFGFLVTPSGGRTDIAVAEGPLGDPIWNADWNTIWDARSVRDDLGWTVEIRIPFSSLRFEADADGRVPMKLIVWRYLARNGEYDTYPRLTDQWQHSAFKAGQAAPIFFREIEQHLPLHFKPYVLAGVENRSRLADAKDVWLHDRTWRREFGGDVKANLTSNLVLDVTANTDFAQVEADDQVLNLERLSLFFPEKRDFFQERSDLFDFSFPGVDRLFNSRSIGIQDGQPVPIRGGVRVTGSHHGWDVGFLEMQTGGERPDGLDVRDENFGVLRVRRPFGSTGGYVGGIFTSRADLDTQNFVYGLDSQWRRGKGWFFTFRGAQSAGMAGDPLKRVLGLLIVQRQINRNFMTALSLRHVGPDFHTDVGFMQRTGFNRYGLATRYTRFSSEASPLQSHTLSHNVELIWDDRMERLETQNHRLTWNFEFKHSASASAGLIVTSDAVDRPFKVGTITIPADEYRFVSGIANFMTPAGSSWRLDGNVSGGEYYGGHRFGTGLNLTWSAGPRLSIGASENYDNIDLPVGTYAVLISRVRITTALSRTITGSAYIQHHSADNTLSPNVRIRYNPREGSDLYLVYNEGINTSLVSGDPLLPRLPRSQGRLVQVKYTYTFSR